MVHDIGVVLDKKDDVSVDNMIFVLLALAVDQFAMA